jgi:hypothetical protein
LKERAVLVGPNPYKLYSFAEVRAVLGPLWIRCDRCRRFPGLRITRALRDRDYRHTRFTCRRCGGPGCCTSDRPDCERDMEDYVLDRGPVECSAIGDAARRLAAYSCRRSCAGSRPVEFAARHFVRTEEARH